MATTTLKILRDLHGYTQIELGDVLNISQNAYSRLERNPKSLTAEQAQKLAEFYNVGISDLLSESAPVITFTGSTFNSGSNAFNNNIEEQNYHYHDKEVGALKEEVEYLRAQNMQLLKLLEKYSSQ